MSAKLAITAHTARVKAAHIMPKCRTRNLADHEGLSGMTTPETRTYPRTSARSKVLASKTRDLFGPLVALQCLVLDDVNTLAEREVDGHAQHDPIAKIGVILAVVAVLGPEKLVAPFYMPDDHSLLQPKKRLMSYIVPWRWPG